jgi:anhydro-N-acetylmuramic acid kinase
MKRGPSSAKGGTRAARGKAPRQELAYQKPMRVLGLMSGTSADGIDAALVEISGEPPHFEWNLRGFASIPYPRPIRSAVLRLGEGRETTTQEISQLNFALGKVFAEAAAAACKQFGVPIARVDLIGSHGQTIYHQGKPSAAFGERGIASTMQIGEPSVIAALAGVNTIGDFRPADLALGGQGAPLVPFVDYVLFRDAHFGRVSLNIGGIANVTVIPADAQPEDVFAFDTGPGNMLIDALAFHATRGKQRFDRNAKLARTGQAIPALLDKLLADDYFKQKPPKSAGREQYGAAYVERFLAWGRKHRTPPEDLIRTATLLTALSIADAWNRFIRPRADIRQLIVSGGGTRNPLLMALITGMLAGVRVNTSDQLGVPSDAKEAIAFAILAYETWHRRPSNLPAATGARGPAILGKVCYAPPR